MTMKINNLCMTIWHKFVDSKIEVIYTFAYQNCGELTYQGCKLTHEQMQGIFFFEEFEIDESGYEMIVYIIADHNKRIFPIIFQKDRDDRSKIVYPVYGEIVNYIMKRFTLKSVYFINGDKFKLKSLPREQIASHNSNVTEYTSKQIDTHFLTNALIGNMISTNKNSPRVMRK